MEEFLEYLATERNRSPHTILAYKHDILRFAEWHNVAIDLLYQPGVVSPADIRAWLCNMASSGISTSTLRRKSQSLRAFFRWAIRSGKTSYNPAADVTLAKLPRRLPSVIKSDDIEKILTATGEPENNKGAEFRHVRNRLIIEMLFGLGLRQSELLNLTDDQIRADEIRITGKGNKQRVLPLPASLSRSIAHYQLLRDQQCPGLKTPKHLIAGVHGPISKQALYSIVHKALADTPAGRKSPHTLRHSFATAMLNDGANLDAVRQLLGHESLATTQIYTHLTPKQLRQAYDTAHPRAKKK